MIAGVCTHLLYMQVHRAEFVCKEPCCNAPLKIGIFVTIYNWIFFLASLLLLLLWLYCFYYYYYLYMWHFMSFYPWSLLVSLLAASEAQCYPVIDRLSTLLDSHTLTSLCLSHTLYLAASFICWSYSTCSVCYCSNTLTVSRATNMCPHQHNIQDLFVFTHHSHYLRWAGTD